MSPYLPEPYSLPLSTRFFDDLCECYKRLFTLCSSPSTASPASSSPCSPSASTAATKSKRFWNDALKQYLLAPELHPDVIESDEDCILILDKFPKVIRLWNACGQHIYFSPSLFCLPCIHLPSCWLYRPMFMYWWCQELKSTTWHALMQAILIS